MNQRLGKKITSFFARHTNAVVFILCCLVTSIFYYDVVFLGKTLLSPGFTWGVAAEARPYGYPEEKIAKSSSYFSFYKDFGSNAWQGEPQVVKATQSLRSLEIPLWNDNSGMGKPLAANFLSSVFYPLKIILYILPNVQGWEIYLLGRFIVGAFFLFLFLRELKIRILPAFIGGITYAFSGIFVLFQNIQNLDADLIAPLMFWVVAHVINLAFKEKVKWYQYTWSVIALCTVFFTNIPEPLLLVLAAGFIYWVCRLWGLYWGQDRQIFWRGIRITLQVIIPTFLIVAPLYSINYEFVSQSFTLHTKAAQYGSTSYFLKEGLIYNILPYIRGGISFLPSIPPGPSTMNYFGLTTFFLTLLGIKEAFRKRGSHLFLLILGGIILAKIYGEPVLSSTLGKLPGFDRIIFIKYAQTLLSLPVGCMVALALHGLLERTYKWWHILVAGLVGAGLIYKGLSILPDFEISQRNLWFIVIFLLALCFGTVILTLSKNTRIRFFLAGILGVVLISEIWLLIPRKNRPDRYETFTKPPYVSFLQTKSKPFRVFAYEGILYPQLSSAFNLDDIRDIDGLYVNRYWIYTKAFIAPFIGDRFTTEAKGAGDLTPPNIMGNPFADVLNLRFVMSQNPLPDIYPRSEIAFQILAQYEPNPLLSDSFFDINGDKRRVLFMHPTTKTCVPLSISKDKPILRFSAATDPTTWEAPNADGVEFKITDGAGTVHFKKLVDPARNPDDRKWLDVELDLSQYADTEQQICFSTHPNENSNSDWAGWANLRLTSKSSDELTDTPPSYQLVYKGSDALIYENLNFVPRGFLVGNATQVMSEEESLKEMQVEGFDPKKQATVVIRDGQASLPELDGEICSEGIFQNYQRSKAGELSFDYASKGDCLLIWSETYYPGWEALVDGQTSEIYQTNYLFEGIVLRPGFHHIVMRYRPRTFYLPLLGSGVGGLLVIVWSIRFYRSNKRKRVAKIEEK